MFVMIVAIATAITQVMAMGLLGIVLPLLIWHDVQPTSESCCYFCGSNFYGTS